MSSAAIFPDINYTYFRCIQKDGYNLSGRRRFLLFYTILYPCTYIYLYLRRSLSSVHYTQFDSGCHTFSFLWANVCFFSGDLCVVPISAIAVAAEATRMGFHTFGAWSMICVSIRCDKRNSLCVCILYIVCCCSSSSRMNEVNFGETLVFPLFLPHSIWRPA